MTVIVESWLVILGVSMQRFIMCVLLLKHALWLCSE